jgi:hypothetical protein
MRSVLLAMLALGFCASPLLSEDRRVELVGLQRGQKYELEVAPDGTISLRPFQLERVVVGGLPDPVDPAPTPLQARVKALTRDALAAGAKPETAARLAAVYALVSDFCRDGTASPEMVRGTAEKPGLLSQATDAALKDQTDKDKWTAWRQGVGTELALRHPTVPDKIALADTLREVSSAIKAHLGAQTSANGEKLTIPWNEIIELLRPILRDLLLKLLSDWINKGN